MKNQLKTFLKRNAAWIAVITLSATFSSCTKKDNGGNEASKFIGTWNGSTTCTGAGTPTGGNLTLGGSGNTVTGQGNVGTGSCFKNITYSGTASGNTCTFATQSFTDLCSLSYTISGSASISGNTLTFNIIATGAAGNANCTFVGTK